LAPAAVFATSSGGLFALAMPIRDQRSVRGAILHEPALLALFDEPTVARETVTAVVAEGMKSGGRRLALERFVRFVASDANWQALDPSVQERMHSSADTYFDVEIGQFDTYLPSDQALAAIAVPTQLVVSDGSLPYFAQAAARLAPRLGIEVTHTAGTHFAYLDHPSELAETVKPFLRRLGD
jgi:pimeloyl-ACP methyl ester carboxylesterase